MHDVGQGQVHVRDRLVVLEPHRVNVVVACWGLPRRGRLEVGTAASKSPRNQRSNRRNGYRHRDFDTRAGTIDVAIPKLRQGSYFPDWWLTRRKRAERALTSVMATC